MFAYLQSRITVLLVSISASFLSAGIAHSGSGEGKGEEHGGFNIKCTLEGSTHDLDSSERGDVGEDHDGDNQDGDKSHEGDTDTC